MSNTTETVLVKRIRSECGQYFAERVSREHLWYRLYDQEGNFLVQTGYWGNLGTKTRVRFEIATGSVKAIFSRPRYPRWFRRRWVTCWDMWVDELKTLVESFGCEVLDCWKPDINCWSHIGFRATAEQCRKVDEELTRRGVRWNGPPHKPGQWDIQCPNRWP